MEEQLKYLQELQKSILELYGQVDRISSHLVRVAELQEKQAKMLFKLSEKLKELTEN